MLKHKLFKTIYIYYLILNNKYFYIYTINIYYINSKFIKYLFQKILNKFLYKKIIYIVIWRKGKVYII